MTCAVKLKLSVISCLASCNTFQVTWISIEQPSCPGRQSPATDFNWRGLCMCTTSFVITKILLENTAFLLFLYATYELLFVVFCCSSMARIGPANYCVETHLPLSQRSSCIKNLLSCFMGNVVDNTKQGPK